MASHSQQQHAYRAAPPSPATAAAALSLGALSAAPVEPPPQRPQMLAKAIAPAPLPSLSGLPGHGTLSQGSMLAPMRGTPLKPKQKRYRANPEQLRDLVALFNENPSPPAAELAALSARISMPTQSVVLWFKNRRARVPHKKAEKAEAARRREMQFKGAVSAANAAAAVVANAPAPKLPAVTRHRTAADPRIAADRARNAAAKGPVLPPLNIVAPHLLSAAATQLPAMAANPEGAAAALVMAEMAMAKRVAPPPPTDNLAALCSVAMQEATRQGGRDAQDDSDRFNSSQRSIGMSDAQTRDAPERDSSTTSSSPVGSSNFAMRLSLPEDIGVAGARVGEFVLSTPRRPRVLPQTPRIRAQLEYAVGDKVEVMDTDVTKGVCRMWYPGTVISTGSGSLPKDIMLNLSLAAAAVSAQEGSPVSPPSGKKSGNGTDVETDQETVEDTESNVSEEQTKGNAESELSPRTVQSPAASPTPAIAKAKYVVRYEHRFTNGKREEHVAEEIVASRIRPQAPNLSLASGNWRPEPGEAVEALLEGAWTVGVMKTHALRKGYLVCFESGEKRWIRRDSLRPYQIWRGRGEWVVKTKAPATIGRKGVGLSVTHMPEKRKRPAYRDVAALENEMSGAGTGASVSGKDGRRRRSARTKRARSTLTAEPQQQQLGVDGLPSGWTMDSRSKTSGYYVAPDGRRVRSLKEAHRYVRSMESA